MKQGCSSKDEIGERMQVPSNFSAVDAPTPPPHKKTEKHRGAFVKPFSPSGATKIDQSNKTH